MKENNTPVTIRRKDYTPPPFWIESVALTFALEESSTLVTNSMSLRRNPASLHKHEPLQDHAELSLDGVGLELISIRLDGVELDSTAYELDAEQMLIKVLPDECKLTIQTRIYPENNTALEGLYKSSGNYCTQCEAEGFRKITYYLDRPDVLAKYTVRIEADKSDYPVILSNGNKIASGDLPAGRHFAQWSDPFPKPSYLFALVAGKLEALRDSFTTSSGREVELVIYVEAHNLHRCNYAMQALKNAMRWDEQVYGLEYDLDIFMIVAVDDFNMGAMENKGLNIFNSRYVLADHETATDSDFMGVEAVIAHEYFHNWTGNRVTCRDWFQLSLKEGLTVFRDQQFSADMNSRAVKRIEDVRLLRSRQFPEDAGPMAHPIRPDEYMEINNFYTVTVYEKGAEVIRMMHTLLGESGFRRGMDLYFDRFDGQAVTCDDFVQAMQDANRESVNLDQFRRWYSQSGTPVLDISSDYDEAKQTFRLRVSQSCSATPGQPNKLPFHIPLTVALLGADGCSIPLHSDASHSAEPDQSDHELTLDVVDSESTFVFSGVSVAPVASLLRGFSAPVILNFDYSDAELAFLMANDDDEFNRWEAGQRLYKRVIEKCSEADSPPLTDSCFDAFHQAFAKMLNAEIMDPALLAAALTLPGIEAVAESHDVVQIDPLFTAITALKRCLAEQHHDRLRQIVIQMSDDGRPGQQSKCQFSVDSASIGRRSLRNTCLALLGNLPAEMWKDTVWQLFQSANNMTDKVAALRILCNSDTPERDAALLSFYKEWSGERLVIDKWFSLQAMSERPDTVTQVRALTTHPAFELANPNRVRSLLGVFAMSNPVRFHSSDGAGYKLVADFVLELDQTNPQIAARLASPLGRWQRMDLARQQLMQGQLSRIAGCKDLSPDVYEIVGKSLEVPNRQ